MASPANPMTPPPGADDSAQQPGAGPGAPPPTSPAAASPSPPQPSPAMQHGAQAIIGVANTLRGIAKAYPGATPHVTKMLDEIPRVIQAMMASQQPGEPQAGPGPG